MKPHRSAGKAPGGGFSMIELVVVVGIIVIALAAAVPAIARYIRNYEIRATTERLMDDINNARTQAIKKNVNWGVVFVVSTNNRSYAVLLEDDQTPAPLISTRQDLDALIADPVQRLDRVRPPQLSQLPLGIEFAAVGQCPTVANWNPDAPGFRFNRLGVWCNPTGGQCPALTLNAQVNLVWNSDPANPGSTICLRQTTSGLTRWIHVAPGGRIRTMR